MKKWIQRLLEKKQDRIYITPTKNGLIFISGVVVVIIVGATYNNNLVFLLGFFLFSIFIISIVEAHNNLRHLALEAMPVPDQHAGEPVFLPLRIINRGHSRQQIIELFPRRTELAFGHPLQLEDIHGGQQLVRNLVFAPMARGVYQIPRISLSSVYPLGFFRARTVLRAEGEFFLYPNPSGHLPLRLVEEENKFSNSEAVNGHQRGDEFREHRECQKGESFHHIDWKVLARRRKLMVKDYEGTTDHFFSVSFYDVPHHDVEIVLSQLSRWLDQVRDRGVPFELVLPTCKIPFGRGVPHYQKCQRELARYGEAG